MGYVRTPPMPRNILITDDEKLIRWSIAQRLRQRGLTTLEAADARECLERAGDADAVILDYRLPDRSGFDVLRELRRTQPSLPVIMLTAHSSVDHAIEAMKLGAYHYVAKPFDVEGLAELVERALEPDPEESWTGVVTTRALLGASPAIKDLRRLLARIATSPASAVSITGEPGTGKDLAARAIHGESRRHNAPFVNFTCSSSSPVQALEAELFGYERGAFTDARVARIGLVELARGGTLMLDQITELPLALQAKLLRLIEDGTCRRLGSATEDQADVRVIATSSADLDDAVRRGAFRADLRDRLGAVHAHVPPLRERFEDLPLLVEAFVERFSGEIGRRIVASEKTLEAIRARPWPGNVRELKNALEHAVMMTKSDVIEPEDLASAPASSADAYRLPHTGVDIVELERTLLLQALERSGGNQRRAGEMLGMNRDQVRYRMAKFGIPSRPRRNTPS
jgi:two-component system, NtrC family, response regulator AtoC